MRGYVYMHLHASNDAHLTAIPINVVGLERARQGPTKSVSADPLGLTVEGQLGGYRSKQSDLQVS